MTNIWNTLKFAVINFKTLTPEAKKAVIVAAVIEYGLTLAVGVGVGAVLF